MKTRGTVYIAASSEPSMYSRTAEERELRGSRNTVMPSVKRRLLSGGAWAIGGRIATVFTALATNVLLARLLSPQDFGFYFLAFSVAGVGTLLGSLGLEEAVVRFVAESIGLDQFAKARRVLRRTLVLGVLGALGAGATYLFLGPVVGDDLFHAPTLVAATELIAGWIVVLTLQLLLGGVFRSFHDIRLYTVFNGLATGVFLTASLGVLWWLRPHTTLTTVLLLAVGSASVNVILGSWIMRRKVARLPGRGGEDQILGAGALMRVALPLSVTNLTILVLTQADLWILGAFRPAEEVAIYGAAARAVVLVAMPLLVVNTVLAPTIAEMYAQGRKRELERILRAAATVAGIPAFLALAAFILFGGPILGLVFGDYYREGATILALLSLAQLVNVWSGAGSATLAFTGHQATMMALAVAGGLITVMAGLGAVGPYGATGVAGAAAAGISTYNTVLWLVAKRKTGMWTHVGFSGFSDVIRAMKRTEK
jgi:O-antigen/teichoic acid export membrane protein